MANFSNRVLYQDNHFITCLLYLINQAFQIIYLGDVRQYIPAQYIAEFVKSEGFDGIVYNSSMHNLGINYAFFNVADFEDNNSKIYELDSIYMRAKGCNTPVEEDLLHPELKTIIYRLNRTIEKRMMDYNFYHPDIMRGRK